MPNFSVFVVLGALSFASCRDRDAAREERAPVVQVGAAEAMTPGGLALATARTIAVHGDAEILTAPDRFVVTVGFDLQATTLEEARDGSQKRAAALLAVTQRIPTCEVQTEQLSLQPRYDGYNEPGGHRIVGYTASRSLTITLHALGEVEGLLFEMLAAGANRVDKVGFQSSVLLEKRNEARLLAVEAARAKAEAMAAALGQKIGEPLKIEEAGPAQGWQPQASNYMLNNETTPQQSETVATGKIRVHAGVSVVFALQPA